MAHKLPENIKRTFLNTKNETILKACVKYLPQDNMIFDKINLTLMCTYIRNSKALEYAVKRFPIISTTGDDTQIEICDRSKDLDCLRIILEKLIEHNAPVPYLN